MVCVKAHVFFFVLAHMDEMYCIVVCSPVHKRPCHLTGNGGVLGNVRKKTYRNCGNCLISSKYDQIKHCKGELEEDGLVFKQARHESIQSQAINVLQCKTAGLCVCGNTTSSNRWSIQANNCLIISGPNMRKQNILANTSSIKGTMISVESLEGGATFSRF